MLKPLENVAVQETAFLESANVSADDVINRLRGKLAVVPGATLILQSAQDLTIGGRFGNAQYQYTLQSANLDDLNTWSPRLLRRCGRCPNCATQNSDQQDKGLQAKLVIDRDTASRMGITPQTLDNALYDAFGQRQVSTMYRPLNQYHVVMEVAPQFQQTPEALQNIYLSRPRNAGSAGGLHALRAFQYSAGGEPSGPGSVGDDFVQSGARSFSWDRRRRRSRKLSAVSDFRRPITASFQGTAAAFQDSLVERTDPDFDRAGYRLHRAGHALRELHSSHHDPFDDPVGRRRRAAGAAVDAQRTQRDWNDRHHPADRVGEEERHHDDRRGARRGTHQGKKPVEAIYDACILRFRPIMMTTMAALLGGLAAGTGNGYGFRTAPAAGHHDCRRFDREPDADAVHNTSCICLS